MGEPDDRAAWMGQRGAAVEIWNTPNKQGRTPLFIAEGHRGGLPRPSRATIEAITVLMKGAGVSTAGERPVIVDQYARPVEPPKPAQSQR